MGTLQGLSHGAWGSDQNGNDGTGKKTNVVALPTIVFFPFGDTSDRNKGAGISFVNLGGGGTVHGLNVEYEWGDKQPQSVPPCIRIVGHSGPRVTDMRIKNAWDAVSSIGCQNAGRYYIANLFIVNAYNYGVAM